jgi:hypothetical protein
VWRIVASASIGNVLWGSWSSLGPVVAEADLGGAAVWGGVLGAMGVGAFAGAVAGIRVRPRRPLVPALHVFSLFAAPVAMLAAGVPAPLVAAGALLAGAGMMLGLGPDRGGDRDPHRAVGGRRAAVHHDPGPARRPRGSNHARPLASPLHARDPA